MRIQFLDLDVVIFECNIFNCFFLLLNFYKALFRELIKTPLTCGCDSDCVS